MANTTSPPRNLEVVTDPEPDLTHEPAGRQGLARLRSRLSGGTHGNERLTVLTGLLLVVLYAGIGITIVWMGQLLWWHLFLGITIAGPIGLKLASTGYKFSQYYLGDHEYKRQGPPPNALRMLAPLLILVTLGVLATGLTLLLLGPSVRQPVLLLHKLFFFAWCAVCGVHILAHIPDIARVRSHHRTSRQTRRDTLALETHRDSRHLPVPGDRARSLALLASLIVGLGVATALTGQFHVWTRVNAPFHPPLNHPH